MTRPRIIFVPGLKPKPPPEQHRDAVQRVLLSALKWEDPGAAQLLATHEDWLTLVPWTYRFYGRHRDINLDAEGIDHVMRCPDPSSEDIREIDALARRVDRWWHVLGDRLPWLGRWIARPELRLTMSEARRYLHDHEGIASDIRSSLAEVLIKASHDGETVLLIGHSLGSVIAYDTLWELTHKREAKQLRIDMFLTMGSPLATRFVLRRLHGARYNGSGRYPHNIVRWENFSARGDLTALHPRLKPYFGEMLTLELLQWLHDHDGLYNHFRGEVGLNVHEAYGYLANRTVARCIAGWLQQQAGEQESTD